MKHRTRPPPVPPWSPVATVPAIVLTGVAMIGAGSCDLPRPGDRWDGSIDTTETGVVVVTNSGRGAWNDATAWRLEPVVRIGAPAGPDTADPYVFGRIAGLAVGPDDEVFVLDATAREVRVFDAAGLHRRTLSLEGTGADRPARPAWLERGVDSLLWIADLADHRIAVLDSAGAVVRSARWGWPGGPIGPHRITESGLIERVRLAEPRAGDPDGAGIELVDALVRRPLEGSAAGDTLRLPRFDRPTFTVQRTLEGGPATFFYPVPYAPEPVVAIAPDGRVWLGRTDEYRLTRMGLAGDTDRVVVRELEPEPVTLEDARRAIAAAGRLRDVRVRLDPELLPAVRPFFTGVLIDDSGGLWIRRVQDPAGAEYAGHDPGATWYEVFDAAGRFLGPLPAPVEAVPPPRITGDRLIGVLRDSLGVGHVSVYRIVR